jgi:hypothetical protein
MVSTVTQYTLRRLTTEDGPVVTPLLVREWGAAEVLARSPKRERSNRKFPRPASTAFPSGMRSN